MRKLTHFPERLQSCSIVQPGILKQVAASGYKVVFMRPKFSVTTIASYDVGRQPPPLARRAGAAKPQAISKATASTVWPGRKSSNLFRFCDGVRIAADAIVSFWRNE